MGTPAPFPAGVPASPQPWGEQGDGEQLEVQPDLSEHLDADHNDAPLRLRSMDSIVGDAVVPGQAVRNLEQGQLFAVAANEPATLAEADQDVHWRAAMTEEIQAIEGNHTWVLTDLPPGRKVG
jgi:hypothetical protein